MEIKVKKNVLGKNDRLAAEIRKYLSEKGIFAINLISSPGAGKTTILEETCARLKDKLGIAVVEGDITTTRDADRIARHGVPVHQIETQGACHLDARMLENALEHLDLDKVDLLIIENVGNLVCPATFDLGEDAKIVVLSVPEGDDKPAKYPGIFRRAKVLLLNKIDLLEISGFDKEKALRDLAEINPDITVFETSATKGTGMDEWCQWLADRVAEKKKK
ncbi:MAG: hydrogenase nickel incorporation protein HypB [Firmicutes bacterium]|nr:hydrogenase nickel incorporation protein HypB [Bacillota bacterium]